MVELLNANHANSLGEAVDREGKHLGREGEYDFEIEAAEHISWRLVRVDHPGGRQWTAWEVLFVLDHADEPEATGF
jgi:hypothetical protein